MTITTAQKPLKNHSGNWVAIALFPGGTKIQIGGDTEAGAIENLKKIIVEG